MALNSKFVIENLNKKHYTTTYFYTFPLLMKIKNYEILTFVVCRADRRSQNMKFFVQISLKLLLPKMNLCEDELPSQTLKFS